jgi:hypothetical protein
MNSKYQISIYDNASSDKFDYDNKNIYCTPTNSMIYKFLDVPKKKMKILYILLPQVKNFTL